MKILIDVSRESQRPIQRKVKREKQLKQSSYFRTGQNKLVQKKFSHTYKNFEQ